MHSAIVRSTKPTISNKAEASATSDSCCGVNACCTPAEQAGASINTVAEAESFLRMSSTATN
jgi:hypothetical protein